MVSLLLFSQGVVGIASASAKVVNRAQGRCKLSTNDAVAYDGHCVIKHKENNQGDEVVVVKLDNDAKYRFYGPNLDALQVQAWDGIHNVRHRYRNNSVHELFKVSSSSCYHSAGDCCTNPNHCPKRNSH